MHPNPTRVKMLLPVNTRLRRMITTMPIKNSATINTGTHALGAFISDVTGGV